MEMRSSEGNKTRIAARRTLRAVLLASLLSGCAPDDEREPPASRSIVADVIIAVDNRSWRPMSIYVEAGQTEHSLGAVPGRSSRSFSLPSGAGDSTTDLQLEARERHAGARVRSRVFRVSSGQRISWTLQRSGSGTMTLR
jgi:hypothetical protein